MKTIRNLPATPASLIALLLFFLAACTGTGRLREGERLYAGAKVKTTKQDKDWKMGPLKADLKKAVTLPRPNRKILWMRPKLSIYNTFHNRREKSLGNFIATRFGEPPVLYNSTIPNRHRELLRERAANDGVFNTRVDTEEKIKKKTVKLRHQVFVLSPRREITDVKFLTQDSSFIAETLKGLSNKSLVKAGKAYRLENLMAERQRLADTLRNHGWYYFTPDDLLFEADTVTEPGQLTLELTIKPEVSQRDRQRYTIGAIRINPNYDLSQQRFGLDYNTLQDSLRRDSVRRDNDRRLGRRDTLKFNDCLTFVYRRLDVEPHILANQIFLHCGEYYSNNAYQATTYRLLNLNLYKFINIRFVPATDSTNVLNARINLTPYVPQRVEASASGLFSPGFYSGIRGGIAYTHRNAFRKAESLRLALNGAYLNTNKENFDFQDFWVSDASAQLTLPRFIFVKEKQSRAFNTTRFSLRHEGNWFKYDLEDLGRFLLSFQRLRGEAGYIWKKDRRGSAVQEFNPVSVGLQYATINDRAVKRQLLAMIPEDETGTLQFLLTFLEYQPNYTFTIDERLEPAQRHTRYFRQRFSAQASGYLRTGGDALPDDFKLSNPLNLFSETDFRVYQRTHGRNILASRLAFSLGQPLKKDGFIALLDRYAIGGASSVRAFAPRTVGPGRTPRDTDNDQGLNVGLYTGNLLLEGNLEYRMPLGRYPELAVFVDAGNVWLTSGPDATEDSKFRFNRFYRELASGAGVGLRVNLGFFVLRLDVAFPLSKPYLPEGQRWVGNDLRFGSKAWRGENLNWNFSFGYPF